MIGSYKAISGDDRYDELYALLCETMNRRLQDSPALNLPTYPEEPIYVPDMLVAIVALKQFADLNKGRFFHVLKLYCDITKHHMTEGIA